MRFRLCERLILWVREIEIMCERELETELVCVREQHSSDGNESTGPTHAYEGILWTHRTEAISLQGISSRGHVY